MQSRSHRRGGDLFAGKSPIHNALTLLHALLQQTHRRYLTSNPLPSNYEHSCKIARGGPKTERLIGNEVWRTRDASPPPHYPAGSTGGRSRNRWLIVDFIRLVGHLWGYQNLKKNLHPQPPPSIIGTSDWPEFGSNAIRILLSSSMAC